MNGKDKKADFIKNLPLYLLGGLLIIGLKLFYSRAECDQLKWILAPTTGLVSALSGIPFRYVSGVGYVNRSLLFIIAPSCSGMQFMLITAATLIFSFLHRMDRPGKASRGPEGRGGAWRFLWIPASLALSYGLTLPVNALRILLSIYLPEIFLRRRLYVGVLTPGTLHTAIGTLVYFVSLITIYRMAAYFTRSFPAPAHGSLRRTLRRCAPPVFWYLLMVLGLPLLNGAYGKDRGAFTSFALLVLCVCSAVLCLFGLISFVRDKLTARSQSPAPPDLL